MRKKIILVGCGNIGSRHLQAIAKLSYDIQVDIVEPNNDAVSLAKTRLNEMLYDKTNHEFFWHRSINELTDVGDVVIVATNSVNRVDLISDLISKGNTRFLIEKLVCQSITQYNIIIKKVKESNSKVWVNTNRRYFKSYNTIKELLQREKILSLSVKANSKNGLSTNAIHYIDLFSWLIEDYEITLNGKLLSDQLLQNKRGPNFKEFSGIITGIAKNNSSLSIEFLPYLEDEVFVEISTNELKMIIDETNEKITTFGNMKHYNLEFKNEPVSNISTKIINDILEDDKSLLPTLNDSFIGHAELFRIFNSHINKLLKENLELCPIT